MTERFPKNNLLFRGMSEQERADCLEELATGTKTYQKDELILLAGDVTDRLGMVLSGSVTIETNDVWGNCTILSHVGKGQVFAETYALLPGEVLLVDVRANEDCEIGFVRVGGMLREETPAATWAEKFQRNLLQITAQKNLALSGRSFHTAPKSVRGRVLSYLNAMSLQNRSTEFDIPFDRQQLADYLNLDRTSLSKELGRMKREGIIQCRKNHFRLLKGEE